MRLTINLAGASEEELIESLSSIQFLIARGFTDGGMDRSKGGGYYFELEGKEPKKMFAKKSNPPYQQCIWIQR